MNLNFISKATDKLRKVLSKEQSSISKDVEEETEILVEQSPGELLPVSPKVSPADSIYVKQVRQLLIRDEKVVGKPFNARNPEIRVVPVDSFVGAFVFFLRLCDQRLLTYQLTGDHFQSSIVFPDGNGKLSFTDKVKCRNKAVIAVLKVEVTTLEPKICEIRFEIK